MSALKKALSTLNPRSSSRTRENGSGNNSETDSPRRSGTFGFGRQSAEYSRKSTDLSGSVSPHRTSKDSGHRMSHSPLGLLRRRIRRDSEGSHSSTEDLPLNRDGEPMSKGQLRKHERQAEKEKLRREAHERVEADAKRKEDMRKKAEAEETPEQKARYGTLAINSYAPKELKNIARLDIKELSPSQVGETVVFRARIHNLRKLSAHLMFVELRQQTATIQGILHEHGDITQFFLY